MSDSMSGPWLQSIILCQWCLFWWQQPTCFVNENHLIFTCLGPAAIPAITIRSPPLTFTKHQTWGNDTHAHITDRGVHFPSFYKETAWNPLWLCDSRITQPFFFSLTGSNKWDEYCWPVIFCPPPSGTQLCDCHISSVCEFTTGFVSDSLCSV